MPRMEQVAYMAAEYYKILASNSLLSEENLQLKRVLQDIHQQNFKRERIFKELLCHVQQLETENMQLLLSANTSFS